MEGSTHVGPGPAAAVLAAVAVGLTGACANQSPPPGGPQDRRPPVVVQTVPDTFGQMLDRDGSVRFQFDERISENISEGDIASAVTVSPLTGDVRVSHGRTSISVSLDGGFRPGLRYRVTLLPVVSDMFGNRMRDAFEVVFTTGGEQAPTATLAGEVWDRLSGRGVNGATVQAVGADSLVHVARADAQGVFAFRYLPTGDFVLTGYQDGNRDRQIGPREARGLVPISVSEGDTLVVEIPVLAPDTTPAVVGGAQALDSITLVVEFDDYLDPEGSSDQVGLRLTREGGEAPIVTRLFHEVEYTRYVDQIADSFARLDSIDAAARAAAAPQAPVSDSAAVAGDTTTAVAAAEATPARPIPVRLDRTPPATRTGRVPPGRRLVGLLDAPFVAGEYALRVTSVVNINGLPGGGGDVDFTYEPPPPPADSVAVDGLGDAAGDSATLADPAAAADTLGLFP